MTQKTKMVAATALVLKGPFVLGVSRKDDPTDFGLPGGKVDEGETPEEAVVREVKEETGLYIFDLDVILDMEDDKGFRVLTFSCDYDLQESELYSEEEGVIKWKDPRVLIHGSFGEYNKALFQQVQENDPELKDLWKLTF